MVFAGLTGAGGGAVIQLGRLSTVESRCPPGQFIWAVLCPPSEATVPCTDLLSSTAGLLVMLSRTHSDRKAMLTLAFKPGASKA